MPERDILTAEEIEVAVKEIRWATSGAPGDLALDRILRHLRAIAAPADGDARAIFERLVTRSEINDVFDRYTTAAIHLHAIGALSREGEVAALRGELSMAHSDHVAACDQRDAEIARLTAERDQFAKRADFFQGEHRSSLDEVKVMADEMVDRVDRAHTDGGRARQAEIDALRVALSTAVGMIDLNSDAFDADDYEKNKAEVERLTAIADAGASVKR